MDIRHGADDGNKVRMVLHTDLDHGIAVLFILVCDPFDYAAQSVHNTLFLSKPVFIHLRQKFLCDRKS